jgi:hypothetical protein
LVFPMFELAGVDAAPILEDDAISITGDKIH